METLVVGAGEMGRWFASTTGFETAFADVDPTAAREAARAVGGRTADLEGDSTFDLVCIAVPIPTVSEAIETQADRADRALVDVAGVMEPALAAMAEHAPGVERASLHPLFSAANAPGNVPMAVGRGGEAIDAVRSALSDSGNDVFECTAEEHDEAMETIQAAAHTAVLAYGIAAEEVPDGFATTVSDELEDLRAGISDGDPRVYADIQAAFDGAGAVADAADRIATADRERFRELFELAGGNDPEEPEP